MFVTAIAGDARHWGVGKLITKNGPDCTVEYFDTPMDEPLLHQCMAADIRSLTLPSQTRVYCYNPSTAVWEIGRLLDDHGDTQLVRFPNDTTRHLAVGSVYVRWDRPIVDPTRFLSAGITETPRFTDGRAPFMRSLLRQRAASLGMSALASSAIELESHQIEVVRRVLQDPIQRYLLADEVGLGKTIEAGVLIRQCILDDRDDAVVVILAPDALVSQWRAELTTKFFVGDLLDNTIIVAALSERPERVRRHLAAATMLVIDEAHHLTTDTEAPEAALYSEVVAAAPAIDRVLLLSATPALHNERGFLRMLHLLDPAGYPLDGEDAFRKRIEERQALAEIVASLTPDNALYLDDTLDQLSEMFPDDVRLMSEAGRLRQIILTMPQEDDPDLITAIDLVRDHLSEVYRLHRRVLRHRRRNVAGLTPDRAGVEVIRYRSAASGAAAMASENWRFAEMVGQDATTIDAGSLSASRHLAERQATYALSPASEPPAQAPRARAEYHETLTSTVESQRARDRIDELGIALRDRLTTKSQFIVFCSDPATADEIARSLKQSLDRPVDRHDPASEEWRAFGDDPTRTVLVCDRRAEEGLNLQGGEKTIVHYDLPWNPNRIEQRLGRADRYGSGASVKSLLLCCEDDVTELAWSRYVDEGLQVFDRSIASLQYLIEKTVHELPALLLTEGAEGLVDLLAQDGGDSGRIAREIRNINQQDALDALGSPPEDTLDALTDIDDEWRQIEADLGGWIQTTLMFGRNPEPPGEAPSGLGGAFRYRYLTGAQHTLLPLDAFFTHCEPAIDRDVRVSHSSDVSTTPYSYRRLSVLSRQGRSLGTRLLRYGDPLLTGLRSLAERDERGRSTAFWRHLPAYKGGSPGLYFRFDFVVEADIAPAYDILELSNRLTPAAASSLKRRGDMALEPSFHTIWLDSERRIVSDAELLSALDAPYRVSASDQGGRDFNLNPRRWRALKTLGVDHLSDWGDLCSESRAAAEAALRSLPALNEELAVAARRAETLASGRLGLLQARAALTGQSESSDERDLRLESDLAAQLIDGIRTPKISLDAVCACFVSADLAVATALARI